MNKIDKFINEYISDIKLYCYDKSIKRSLRFFDKYLEILIELWNEIDTPDNRNKLFNLLKADEYVSRMICFQISHVENISNEVYNYLLEHTSKIEDWDFRIRYLRRIFLKYRDKRYLINSCVNIIRKNNINNEKDPFLKYFKELLVYMKIPSVEEYLFAKNSPNEFFNKIFSRISISSLPEPFKSKIPGDLWDNSMRGWMKEKMKYILSFKQEELEEIWSIKEVQLALKERIPYL